MLFNTKELQNLPIAILFWFLDKQLQALPDCRTAPHTILESLRAPARIQLAQQTLLPVQLQLRPFLIAYQHQPHQVDTQFLLSPIQQLVSGAFQQVLQLLTYWLSAVAAVVEEMADLEAAEVRFSSQPITR
jgi:hypothetical protein